jgi:hypothetical protein
MTQLERSMSKTAFAALERIRHARGIRTRAKALELALLELAPEYEPLTEEDRRIIEERLAEAARGEIVPAAVVYAELGQRYGSI